MPNRLVSAVTSCDILPYFRSDHSYVYLKINLPYNTPFKRSFWKLNTDYLSHNLLQEKIKSFWSYWQSQKPHFQNQTVWWDGGKLGLRPLLLLYSKQQVILSNQKYKSLHDRLSALRRLNDLGDQTVLPSIFEVELKLQHLFDSKVQGAKVRARAQWAEGEKSSRYFFSLEKKRARSSLIHGVYRQDGSIAMDMYDVVHTFSNFYKNLFTCENLNIATQNSILQTLERSLSTDEATSCEGLLSEGECLMALKGMATGKTPGIDGLPAEFYLTFWPLIGKDFVQIANFAYHHR